MSESDAVLTLLFRARMRPGRAKTEGRPSLAAFFVKTLSECLMIVGALGFSLGSESPSGFHQVTHRVKGNSQRRV